MEKKEIQTIAIVLTDKTNGESPKQNASIEVIAKSLSLVAIPIVLAIGGWFIQNAVSSRAVEQAYVELAVSVLTANEDEVDPDLRQWAVELLNSYSAVDLEPGVARKLASGKIALPERTYELGASSDWWKPIRGEVSFELTEGSERYGIRLEKCNLGNCDFEIGFQSLGVTRLTLRTGEKGEVVLDTGGTYITHELELVHIALSRLGTVVSIKLRDRSHVPFSP